MANLLSNDSMRNFVVAILISNTLFAAELPVNDVVLFKHGVGYFSRSGSLNAGETIRLDFKAAEMNDVLKSLTVEDRSGGKIVGLRYDSSETLENKLGDYPFQISNALSLSGFLDQLKGAKLEIELGSGKITGTIITARISPARANANLPEPMFEQEQLVLLLDSGELRSYNLAAITSMRLTEPALQAKLKDYLSTLAGARSQDKRSVYIDSTNSGSRQITASYMVPTPIWKSSYRLILGGQDPMLEGWAIVDNTSGEDWTNVRLSLISGRPISFISPLYEPRYRQRQTAELPDDGAQGPVVYEGAMDALKNRPAAGLGGGSPGGSAGGVLGGIVGGVPSAAPPPPPAPINGRLGEQMGLSDKVDGLPRESSYEMLSVVADVAQGQALGELFEYKFDRPVTVRKNESAMLPFLQQKITSRKLLIYTGQSSSHPLNSAELTNTTGKTLDGGPITVYDANNYAGEALVETVKAGDKRLISYGVDLGTRITTKIESGEQVVREVHANRGTLRISSAIESTTTYTIRNVDKNAKTLIVETPIRSNFKVLAPKPSESTPSAYRFEVKLSPDSESKFVLKEERALFDGQSISNLNPDMLLLYSQNKAIPAAAKRALTELLDKKRQVAATASEIQQTDTDVNELVNDQERLRRNIQSLNQVNGQGEQVQKYARTLADQEARLTGLRDRLSALRKQKSAQETEALGMIERMDF